MIQNGDYFMAQEDANITLDEIVAALSAGKPDNRDELFEEFVSRFSEGLSREDLAEKREEIGNLQLPVEVLIALGGIAQKSKDGYLADFYYRVALEKCGNDPKTLNMLASTQCDNKGHFGWAFDLTKKASEYATSSEDKQESRDNRRKALSGIAGKNKAGIATVVRGGGVAWGLPEEDAEVLKELGDIVSGEFNRPDRLEQAVICYDAALEKDAKNSEILEKARTSTQVVSVSKLGR